MALIIESVSELYRYASDVMSAESFMGSIKELVEDSGGLLDEITAASMVLGREGIKPMPARVIGYMNAGEECVLPCHIDWISDVKLFQRKGGGEGRMVNMILSDSTDKAYLTVWNTRIVDAVKAGMVKPYTFILIHRVSRDDKEGEADEDGKDLNIRLVLRSGAYITNLIEEKCRELEDKIRRFEALGSGVNVDSIGSIMNLSDSDMKANPMAYIKATINQIIAPRDYEKNGRNFSMGKVLVYDGTGSIWVVMWSPAANLIDGFELGDNIEISAAKIKSGLKGDRELHVSKKNQVKK